MWCFQCGREIDIVGRPHRQETCPECLSYLHCCRNCRFYDIMAPKQCREPMSIPVKEKEGGNACHYFQASETKPGLKDKQNRNSSRQKLDDLFKS